MAGFTRLVVFLRPYWKWVLAAPVLMTLEVAMDLLQPRLMQIVIDEALPLGDAAWTLRLAAIMGAVAVLGLGFGFGCGVFANLAGLSMGADLRGALMRKVQTLAHADLDRLQTGALVTRLTNDVEQVQEAVMMMMRVMVRAPLIAVGALIMAVITYRELSWLLLAIMPVFFLSFLTILRRGHRLFLALQSKLDRVNVVFRENLAGAPLVRAFVRVDHEKRRFGGVNDDWMNKGIEAGIMTANIWPLILGSLSLGTVAAIWLGGWQVHRGEAQLGQLLALMQYLGQVLFALMMVGMVLIRMIQAGASAERIVEVLDAQPSLSDPVPLPAPAALPAVRGAVVYDQVTFTYAGEHAEPALIDTSFELRPGEALAVVGTTGSGKSTLVNLLPRLYEVTEGQIRLDGLDVREWPLAALREAVAIVPQVPSLFSRSIADNIRFGRPEATDEEVRAAARLAQAERFIEGRPDGFDTRLEAGGHNLSGGQRQRLAIARAVCCRPAVLILDDCTSALDAGTEARLLAALAAWEHPCTKLIVAQRLGAIRAADRVLVLSEGRAAALGTHTELLASSDIYRDIVTSQADQGDADAGLENNVRPNAAD